MSVVSSFLNEKENKIFEARSTACHLFRVSMPVPPDISEEIQLIPWSDQAAVFPARGGRCPTSSLFKFVTLF